MRGKKTTIVSNTPKAGSFFKNTLSSGLNFFKKQGQSNVNSIINPNIVDDKNI
jgi:hypothetical protein